MEGGVKRLEHVGEKHTNTLFVQYTAEGGVQRLECICETHTYTPHTHTHLL